MTILISVHMRLGVPQPLPGKPFLSLSVLMRRQVSRTFFREVPWEPEGLPKEGRNRKIRPGAKFPPSSQLAGCRAGEGRMRPEGRTHLFATDGAKQPKGTHRDPPGVPAPRRARLM